MGAGRECSLNVRVLLVALSIIYFCVSSSLSNGWKGNEDDDDVSLIAL